MPERLQLERTTTLIEGQYIHQLRRQTTVYSLLACPPSPYGTHRIPFYTDRLERERDGSYKRVQIVCADLDPMDDLDLMFQRATMGKLGTAIHRRLSRMENKNLPYSFAITLNPDTTPLTNKAATK